PLPASFVGGTGSAVSLPAKYDAASASSDAALPRGFFESSVADGFRPGFFEGSVAAGLEPGFFVCAKARSETALSSARTTNARRRLQNRVVLRTRGERFMSSPLVFLTSCLASKMDLPARKPDATRPGLLAKGSSLPTADVQLRDAKDARAE